MYFLQVIITLALPISRPSPIYKKSVISFVAHEDVCQSNAST